MSYINELWGEKVQYGNRAEVCEFLVTLKDKELVYQIKALGEHFANDMPPGNDGISEIQNTTYNENNNMRQWTWQVCTQMGFLFTPSINSPITSPKLDLKYWLNYCKRAFGQEMDPKEGIKEMNM